MAEASDKAAGPDDDGIASEGEAGGEPAVAAKAAKDRCHAQGFWSCVLCFSRCLGIQFKATVWAPAGGWEAAEEFCRPQRWPCQEVSESRCRPRAG